MGKRNEFKYRCADCKAETFMHTTRLIRASLPRCPSCGSLYLDPVTKTARDRITEGQTAMTEQAKEIERKMGKQS